MHRFLRDLSLSLSSLCLLAAVGCTHKSTADEERSEVGVTDQVRSEPVDRASVPSLVDRASVPPPVEKPINKVSKPLKRTQAAAARTTASVAEAPKEGSDEEYAADVDAAMSDTVSTAQTDSGSVAVNSVPDNSRVNRLNDGDIGLTADQQGNSKSDIEITRKIRRSITSRSELSTYAHNVKIITRDGRVVLKGPVRSETERQVIEDLAVNVAGASNVSSGIEIKTK